MTFKIKGAPDASVQGIQVPADRQRKLDPAKVESLAASIKDAGLLQPIVVYWTVSHGSPSFYTLVCGAHRLAAFKKLRRTTIPIRVIPEPDAELAEIDENLIRSELSALEAAEHHARRKAILVERGAAATPGGNRANSQLGSLPSYADKTATDLGISATAVHRAVARAENITPEVKDAIRADPTLDKGTVLDALAATPKADQPAKLAEIKAERATPRAAAPKAEPVTAAGAEVSLQGQVADLTERLAKAEAAAANSERNMLRMRDERDRNNGKLIEQRGWLNKLTAERDHYKARCEALEALAVMPERDPLTPAHVH
jgi:ParB family chromosome partitioning protein